MAVQNERVRGEIGPTAAVAAGTGDVWFYRVVGPTGAKYRIDSAHLMPHNAVTANGTNYSTYTFKNETTTVTLATRAYSATDSVAGTAEALTVAAAGVEVTAGDVLSWTKAETASGLAAHNTCGFELVRIK
jgi:hypothetical protein